MALGACQTGRRAAPPPPSPPPPSPPPPGLCADYGRVENAQAAASQSTVYVSPALAGRIVGTYVLAAGDDEAALFARGPFNPPDPERCCAICSGVAYQGTTHALTHDTFRTDPIDACAAFALHFWTDTVTNSWYCKFYTTTDHEPVDIDAQDDPEPAHFYSVHPLS